MADRKLEPTMRAAPRGAPHLVAETDDTAVVAEVIRRHRPLVERFARWLADGDPDLADELVQETLIRPWGIGPARYGPATRRMCAASWCGTCGTCW